MASDFTELEIWRKASTLLGETVRDINSFPSKAGTRCIGDQLFRSVSSISANIAEGFGRRTTREFVRSCVIARGEIDESRNWYFHCRMLSYLSCDIVEKRNNTLMELRKMVSAFIASLCR